MGDSYCNLDKLPTDAIGLTLHRIDSRERLHSCEPVIFVKGRAAVDTTLRRAALAGKVDVGGKIDNHFADVVATPDGSWSETVALDAKSYRVLKNRWMRTTLVREEVRMTPPQDSVSDVERLIARIIIGPRNPLPPGSRCTLEQLQQMRWDAATKWERADAEWAARAIRAALTVPINKIGEDAK